MSMGKPLVPEHAGARLPFWAWIGLVLLTLFALAPYRRFAGDDAHITFRFVRNLVAGDGFAFNPGEPTYGATAPLWVLLVAGIHAAGMSVPAAAHILNAVFAAASMLVFLSLASFLLRTRWAIAVAGVLLALDPWAVRWNMSGMENPLALLLVLGVLWSQVRWRNSGRVNWIAPLCLSLGLLVRPEFAALVLVWVMDTLLFERRSRSRTLFCSLVIGVCVLGPWLLYAYLTFGTVVPNTVLAKMYGHHLLSMRLVLLYLASFWLFQAIGVAGLAGALAHLPSREVVLAAWKRGWLMVLAWAVVLPAFYVAAGSPVAGRYLMFALPCFLLLGVRAWELLVESPSDVNAKATRASVMLAAMLAACLAFYAVHLERGLLMVSLAGALVAAALWHGSRRVASVGVLGALSVMLIVMVQAKYSWYVTQWPQGMDPRLIAFARRVAEKTPPDAVIAADQIGVIGYVSNRRILDILGLVSPEMIPILRKRDERAMWSYLRERGVDYLFVLPEKDYLVRQDPGYKSIQLMDWAHVRREGAGSALGELRYYFYKTNW